MALDCENLPEHVPLEINRYDCARTSGNVAQFGPVYEFVQSQEQDVVLIPLYVPDGEPWFPQDCPFAPVVHDGGVAQFSPMYEFVQVQKQELLF